MTAARRRIARIARGRGSGRLPRGLLRRGRWRDLRPTRCAPARSPTSLTDPVFRRVAWFTLWQAVVSTVLTLVVGLPAAYVVARFDFPAGGSFRAFVTVPFVLPTVVVATAFLALLRPGGPLAFLHWQRGVAPLLVAHVFFNVAVVVRTVGGFWANLDPRREEAARMLGASRSRAFRDVTLPLLAPAIIAAASIVFLFTFTSFGVVLLLSDPRHATLEVEIYRQAVDLFDLRTAAALALRPDRRGARGRVRARRGRRNGGRSRNGWSAAADSARRPRGRETLRGRGSARSHDRCSSAVRSRSSSGARCTSAGTGASGRSGRLGSSASTTTLFVSPWAAVRNSVEFAIVATRDRARRRRTRIGRDRGAPGRVDAVPRRVPHAAARHLGGHGRVRVPPRVPSTCRSALETSPFLVPIAHAVVAIPFVVRAVVPALRSIDPRLRDAAAMLGASPRRVWREVDLPITRARVRGRGRASARRCRSASSARRCSSPARLADGADRDLSASSPGPGRSTSTSRWRCR